MVTKRYYQTRLALCIHSFSKDEMDACIESIKKEAKQLSITEWKEDRTSGLGGKDDVLPDNVI